MILQFLADIPLPEGPESSFWEAFLRMLFSLGVVLMLLYGILWILKRTVYGKIQKKDVPCSLEILEFRPLSHKTTLYLLEVDGNRILYIESQSGVHTTLLPQKRNKLNEEQERLFKKELERP